MNVIEVKGLWKRYPRKERGGGYSTFRDRISELVRGLLPSGNVLRQPNDFWALQDINFEVKRGECLGIIGPNGAGKSTLLRILTRITRPTHGRVEINGRLACLLEVGTGMHPELSGRENIFLMGAILGMSKAEIRQKYDEIVDFSGVEEALPLPIKRFSSGMQVRLAFSIAVHTFAEILLLDEVMNVGDLAFRAKCANKIGSFREKGGTILLVSHNMHHIRNFSDRVLTLNQGEQLFIGDSLKAIQSYSDISSTGNGPQPFSANERYSTGEFEITNIYFTGLAGSPVESVACDEKVTLTLQYLSRDTPLSQVVLDIVVYDDQGVLFQGTNESCDFMFSDAGEIGKAGEISISFESFRSNSQRLFFAVAFWDRSMTILYDWRRNISLVVRGDPRFSGRSIIPTKWSASRR